MQPVQDEEENSFDPSEFFRHSALADQVQAEEQVQGEYTEQEPAAAADLNNDLQVSESESDEEEMDRNFNPLAGITNEEQNENDDGGFDIDSFYS